MAGPVGVPPPGQQLHGGPRRVPVRELCSLSKAWTPRGSLGWRVLVNRAQHRPLAQEQLPIPTPAPGRELCVSPEKPAHGGQERV